MNRRQVLRGAGITLAGGLGALAGCTDSCDCGQGGQGFGSASESGDPVDIGTEGSSGTGNVGERFYTDGPPTRDGETITATDYASLQEAHDALSPGDILTIPASGGPYRERFEISQDYITIGSDGARIEQPDNSENYAIGSDSPSHNSDATLVGQHEPGAQSIRVSDTTPFSVGDDIHITEDRRPYGRQQAGGAGGASTTSSYRTITAIGNGELGLNNPLQLPYPNEAETETAVGVMAWTAVDVRLTGLTVRGTRNTTSSSRSSRPMKLHGLKQAWIDNLTISGGGNYSLGLSYCYQCRTNSLRLEDGLRYGINTMNGSTDTMHTNIEGDGLGRYIVRFGAGGGDSRSTTSGFVDGVSGTGMGGQFVANSHDGSYGVRWQNIEADGERIIRMRARDMVVDGFTGRGNPSYDFRTRQLPTDIVIRNGEILDKPDGAGDVFSLDLQGGNQRGENLTFESIEIEPYDGRDITEIGDFHSSAVIDGLRFEEVFYGEQRLQREHVEQWDGYDPSRITNLEVI